MYNIFCIIFSASKTVVEKFWATLLQFSCLDPSDSESPITTFQSHQSVDFDWTITAPLFILSFSHFVIDMFVIIDLLHCPISA